MILELAEGPRGRRKRGSYHVQGYFRRYPKLSDGPSDIVKYVRLPNQGVLVRQDHFYDSTQGMSAGEFQMHCLSEGMDFQQLAELSKGRAARKAQREVKKDKKVARKAAKPRNVRRLAKTQSKAVVRETRATKGLVKQEGKSALRTSRGISKETRSANPNRGQNFRAFTQSVFSPKAQPEPETIDIDSEEVETLPAVDPSQYAWPDPSEYADPNANLEPETDQYYEQVEIPEGEPEYMMAEGLSISRTQVLTGLGVFAAGYLGGKLVDRFLRAR